MTYLFDICSEDSPQKRPKRRRPVVADKQPPVESTFSTAGYSVVAIGRVDGQYECAGGCRGWTHDLLDEDAEEWRIQCVVCGTGQFVPAEKREHSGDEFVMNGGRFDGLTLYEISERPHGHEFLEWAASWHPRGSVKAAAKLWLTKRRHVN